MTKSTRTMPAQFDFGTNWSRLRSLFDTGGPAQEGYKWTRDRWREIAHEIYDQSKDDNSILAKQNLQKHLNEAVVMTKDLPWLQKNMESFDLMVMNVSIANQLFPDTEWQIHESEQHTVVSNPRRDLVFDLKYFDRLSGEASMLFAGCHEYASPAAERQIVGLLDTETSHLARAVAMAQEHLAQFYQENNVVPLRPKSSL